MPASLQSENTSAVAAPPIAHPAVAEGAAPIRCACPPGHVRLRKIMLSVVGLLLLAVLASLAYIAWSGGH